MKIVAIGGGEIKGGETLEIDQFIVGLTKKTNPRALFIPTASGDAKEYCETFDKIYGGELGCRTTHLKLLSHKEDRFLAAKKIQQADLIYVGGGNTLRMMKLWRKLGVDKLLYEAAQQGTVLSGLSAGAICWHAWGHSDSASFSTSGNWSYIRVKGLGLVPHLFCPHLDAEKRHHPLKEMIRKHGGLAIACDNQAAVFYENGAAQCFSPNSNAKVYVYRKTKKEVTIKAYTHQQTLAI